MQSYPLMLEHVNFLSHNMVGIYPMHDEIAFIHVAFSCAAKEEYEKEGRTPSYAILDLFSESFDKHRQSYLSYYEREIFSASDAACYWENGRFFINTKRCAGFGDSIAKVMEVRNGRLTEVGAAPAPIQQVYHDSKIYIFGAFDIYMVSPFVMECRCHMTEETVWKRKLSAYLYTEIENRNGMLYFGTAGNGGSFYAVSMADGSVVFRCNTGGTVNYLWYQDCILLADHKGKPVLLDSKDGAEIRKIDFGKFVLTADQFMIVKDNRLYAVAGREEVMYGICADL